jgi:hypothetical protein
MNIKSQVFSQSRGWQVALHLLLGVTLLNYVAQIPYYVHFYGIHHSTPSPSSVAILLGTLILFLVGYALTLQAKRVGAWLLLVFLLLGFGGYLLHNLSGAFLQDLPTGDPLFFTVSLIGYLNFFVSFIYLIIMAKNYRPLLFQPRHA